MKKKILLSLILILALWALFGYLHTKKNNKINFMTSFLEKRERVHLTFDSTLREFLTADYPQQQFVCRMLAELEFTHNGMKYDEWAWWYFLTSLDELARDDVYGKATIEEIVYLTVAASEAPPQSNSWKRGWSI